MPSKIILNGEAIYGDATITQVLFLLLSKIIESGKTESLSLHTTEGDKDFNTLHHVTPTSTLTAVIESDPSFPGYGPMTTNLKLLAKEYFGEDDKLATLLAEDEGNLNPTKP
jgi:hypothetical protein